MSLSIRRRVTVAGAVLATSAALATTAQAGTGISSHYCSGVPSSGVNWCSTSANLPNGWTLYARAEMQGYHGAGAGFSSAYNVWNTSNYVYSHCWTSGSGGASNPQIARGYNVSGSTRNMEVFLFHATSSSDCH